MITKTKIEWTEMTWNPMTGCTKVSPGCKPWLQALAASTVMQKSWPNVLKRLRLTQPLSDLLKTKKGTSGS